MPTEGMGLVKRRISSLALKKEMVCATLAAVEGVPQERSLIAGSFVSHSGPFVSILQTIKDYRCDGLSSSMFVEYGFVIRTLSLVWRSDYI